MINYSFPKQLQVCFEHDIVEGTFAKGTQVNLTNLQQRYPQEAAADLNTVLQSAYRKGLLDKRSEDRFEILGERQAEIISVFQHAAKSGFSPKSIVRAVEVVPASAAVALKLHLPEGEPVFCQTRTRLVNDEVIANQNNYIPIEVCPGLETVDLTHTSFQTTLEQVFHAVVAHIEEHFEIRPANDEDATILGLQPGSDILIVQRLSLSHTRMPLVWADIHVRSDRYFYVKELWPEAASLLENK
ncbi:MAG: UTRA domain-containing protein [Anaerolineae bacterium]|nr:UTRA domain-containing protein [Anaerolineae bacterium]